MRRSAKRVSTERCQELGVVPAYAVFEWGGVVRSDQFGFLLALGLLAVVVSSGRSREYSLAPDTRRLTPGTCRLAPINVAYQYGMEPPCVAKYYTYALTFMFRRVVLTP
jgi:hypothetical protein